MDLRDHLSRILDVFKSYTSEELDESDQTMLDRINEPNSPPKSVR